MDAIEREVRIYRGVDDSAPFLDWIDALDDQTRQKVQARIACVRLGNLGNTRSVGRGVLELKIDFGPGYRVYFGQDGPRLVILLCGGGKRTQTGDIRRAKALWAQYKAE